MVSASSQQQSECRALGQLQLGGRDGTEGSPWAAPWAAGRHGETGLGSLAVGPLGPSCYKDTPFALLDTVADSWRGLE